MPITNIQKIGDWTIIDDVAEMPTPEQLEKLREMSDEYSDCPNCGKTQNIDNIEYLGSEQYECTHCVNYKSNFDHTTARKFYQK